MLSGASARIVIAGFRGGPLPDVVTDPGMTHSAAAQEASSWVLQCNEGSFAFDARAVELQEPRVGLFDELVAPHALKRRERLAARALLWFMRWPGGARLLRAWHARRG